MMGFINMQILFDDSDLRDLRNIRKTFDTMEISITHLKVTDNFQYNFESIAVNLSSQASARYCGDLPFTHPLKLFFLISNYIDFSLKNSL